MRTIVFRFVGLLLLVFFLVLGENILFVIGRVMTKRVHSFEWNNHSYASLVPSNKKVSLPNELETNADGKRPSGWPRRTTAVPMAMLPDDVPNYFGSAMQSMCLTFFTLAYAEVPAPSVDSQVASSF